jgi:hypothetical protein
MTFESHGRKYMIDQYGVIVQTDHRPYVYDAKYSATYDTEEYRRQSDLLQALRLGFVMAAHGNYVKTLMDAGYGNGAFMKFAKQSIPYVYGHDVTGVMVEGCYVLPEFIKADVLTMWDVLEHFPDISFVSSLPYGTICISLPFCHMITEGKEWFDTKYLHRKCDEHIRHFTPSSLALTMDSMGWKEVARSGHEDIVRKSKHGQQNIISMAFKRKL